ncbi:MAG: hypothetical protein ACI8W8_000840, partial [Rhodothermales bacterium]
MIRLLSCLTLACSCLAAPTVVHDGNNIRVGFADGHAFSYSKTSFCVTQIWKGDVQQAPEHGRSLTIKNKPWQHKLRDLDSTWIGSELVGDNVTFRYSVALKGSTVQIE